MTLVGKPDCGLCDQMRAVVEAVLPEFKLTLEERDVRTDPELERRYLFEIPVLLLGELEVTRHRTSAADLRRRLREILAT